MSGDIWAADVPISLPEPIDTSGASVPMFGFIFTEKGLFHDIGAAEHEVLRVPTYSPIVEPSETVYDDGH